MCEGVRKCEHVISGVQMSATVPVCGMCMSEVYVLIASVGVNMLAYTMLEYVCV